MERVTKMISTSPRSVAAASVMKLAEIPRKAGEDRASEGLSGTGIREPLTLLLGARPPASPRWLLAA